MKDLRETIKAKDYIQLIADLKIHNRATRKKYCKEHGIPFNDVKISKDKNERRFGR